MLAVWAERNVVLADEFRDGHVPARMQPLRVAKTAFAALPQTVNPYSYRGDSASQESPRVNWLRPEKREEGPQGFIGFALRARRSPAWQAAIARVPAESWKAYGEPHPQELREGAEVSFVPGGKPEHKDPRPLRYVGLRIRQRQEGWFEDGKAARHFAVVTHIEEWTAGRWIQWQREKAGTIEGVHDGIKKELGGGGLPCQYFGANAAWRRWTVIAHNGMTALQRLALPAELLAARPQRLRFLILNTPGGGVQPARKILLRMASSAEPIATWMEALVLRPVAV